MKTTILALGGALAFASSASARLQPLHVFFAKPSTLVTKPTVSASSATPASSEGSYLQHMLGPSIHGDDSIKAAHKPLVLRQANVEPAETSLVLRQADVEPTETSSISSSATGIDDSLPVPTVDPALANAQALQVLRSQRPVFSNAQVEAARLHGFCSKSQDTTELCDDVKTSVAQCVDDEQDTCSDAELRDTLSDVTTHHLCETTEMLSPEYAICARFFEEILRCNNKRRRGPCAIGHVKYLLRQLRDFIVPVGADATGDATNGTTVATNGTAVATS